MMWISRALGCSAASWPKKATNSSVVWRGAGGRPAGPAPQSGVGPPALAPAGGCSGGWSHLGARAGPRPECGFRAEPCAWSPAAPDGGQTGPPAAAAQSGPANERCKPNYSPGLAGWQTMIDLRTASRSAAHGARHRRAAPASALVPAVPEIRAATVGAVFQAYRLIAYVTFDFNVTSH